MDPKQDARPPAPEPDGRGNRPPAASPPPERGRRQAAAKLPAPLENRPRAQRNGLAFLFLFGLVMIAAAGSTVVIAVLREGPAGPRHVEAGDRFVRFLMYGLEGVPRTTGEDAEFCGYALAYRMLKEDLREQVSYTDFCDTFAWPVEEHGRIIRMDARRVHGNAEWGAHTYRLYFGDPDADPALSRRRLAFDLRLRLSRSDDGAWVVSYYAFQAADDPEIR